MTNSWNNFSIGKLDPKESTTPAVPVLGTTLNLASLAPHDTSPIAPKPANGGSILDAGSGFVTGFGKQAVGTLDAVFGVDNVLLKNNIAKGGSGSTAEGMGWMPAAGKLIHGVSATVSLAYNNPDALLKIPGQLANTWNNGDWATKGDMAGQATFIIGSLFVGGTGAAKASRVAGDLREASVVTKGVGALGETGTTVRSLETVVTGLKGGTSVLGDVGTLGRTTTALTDGANLATDANIIARTGAVDQTVAANLIKTGSFSERVLPLATEGSTKFLVQGETAGSVGLGEISLPNRLLGLQSTEGGAGVVSKFLSRFKPTTELEPALATTVKAVIPKLGEAGTAELITGKVAGAANDLTGTGRIAETLTGRTATEAERLTGLGKVTETVAPGIGKVTESVAPQVLRTEHAVQTVDTLAPHIDQFAQQANILKTTGNVGAHTETFAELETGLAKFKAAGTTADRLENLGQLNRTVSVLEQQGIDATALRGTLTRLQAETQTVERLSQMRTVTADIAEHSTSLTSQTAELTAKFGQKASVQELELATKQLTQATSAVEKAQAFAAVDRAAAKVATDIPEAGAAIRQTVESLRVPVQTAVKIEASEVVATQIADHASTLTAQTAELATKYGTNASVQELELATKQLTQATSAVEKAQAFAAVDRAAAKVATDIPEAGAAIRQTVESLRVPVQTAVKIEASEVVATQIADHASTLTAQTAELATKYGTNASVQELTTATKQLTEATTTAEKAQAFAAVDRAAAKVATDIPEAGAAIRQTVESLRVPVQTAVKVEASEVAATQIAQRSTQLVSDTTQLAAKFSDNVAVQELSTATREFSQASNAVEKAEAYAKVEKAAAAVKDLSPEGAQVARTVESLSAPVETAARAQRLENAVAQVDEHVGTLTAQTKTLTQELAVEGKVSTTVPQFEKDVASMTQATTATEKAQAFQALQKSAAEVASELPGKTTQISKTIESMAPQVETAQRLTQVESVTSRVAYQADEVAQQAALLKSSAALKTETAAQTALKTETALKSETALTELQTSASTFKAATSTERAEQLAQMNKNLRLVEAEVGEAKVAGLRTSVARLENEAGTLDRIAAVDKSTVQVTQQSQAVLRQAAELQAGTTNATVQTALKNIQLGATETGTINAINRTEQLSLRANDIAVVERELGTAAAGKIRTAIADLDRSTAAARTNAVELLDYQGAKITQQVGYLQEGGRLGTNTQALRIDQLQHDVAVMKSIVPADSVVTSHLLRLEQQVNGVDSIANILAHPEVARAPGRELLKLAQSSDAATATAAADRLILKGGVEKLGEGPVSGLISERQQFWNSQKQLSQLEGTVKSQLFESGKLFGLPSSEPIFRKTLGDIAWAIGGLLTLDGSMAYNLNKLSAMARDNVLSAEAAAKAREQDQQPKKDAETKPVESKSPTNNSQTQSAQSAQPAAAGQNSNAIANVQAKAPDAQGGDNNYVRTAQQATFKNDASEVKMSPVAAVYGTPKFLASDETNNIPAGSFPTTGASWWWKQQHGGSPWGFQRGPGAVAAAQEDVKQSVQITPRARGIAATPEADLTKIAQVRFPIPRVMDISNQAMLLNSPNQFSSRAGRNGSGIGSGGPGSRSWTTVDWSQVGAHRLSSSEGGKAAHDLSKLEKDEESGMDAPGNGVVTAQNMPGGPNLNASGTNDPSHINPNNDPNMVVASNQQKKQGQDEESLVSRI